MGPLKDLSPIDIVKNLTLIVVPGTEIAKSVTFTLRLKDQRGDREEGWWFESKERERG